MVLSRVAIVEHAAVASEQHLASLAGYDVLRAGGNAFDAAVATSFTLAVTLHHAGGIGGDFFGMFHEAKTGRVHCLNSSGWAPSGLTVSLVKENGMKAIPTFGPLTCMIPGFVAGVWSMHQKFGTLPFNRLLEPSIRYASMGFPAGNSLCRSTTGAFDSLSPDARLVFAPTGKPPVPGELIRQEALGKVIQEIARSGPDGFYHGWPAEEMLLTLQANGVPSEENDFNFKPEWVKPLEFDYRGTSVNEVPPNSMGATSLLLLKLLSAHDPTDKGPLSEERVELTLDAAEIAYERKGRLLGDPRFGEIDMDEFMRVDGEKRNFKGKVRAGDTTAFSVADTDGNLVSGIQSLYHHFGSRLFVPEAGIMLNNRGAGFSMEGPNQVSPGKRPVHTLSSLILQRADASIAIGASGGDNRPIQHALFVTNLVDYSMRLEEAVDHPRFLWSGGRALTMEVGYPSIFPKNYDVQRIQFPGRTGVCQAIEASGRLRKAVCDVRGDGVPVGF